MAEAEKSAPAGEGGDGAMFSQHLERGSELLAAGRNDEARAELERAFKLDCRSQKAQNLLGLVYFKLGLLEELAEIYKLLVHDNPTDPTLRVNLGLVHLKAGAHDRAIRQLETAVDLSHEGQGPLNYLGLAYQQAGQLDKALALFLKAGNHAMVEKLEKARAAAPTAPPPPAPPPAAPQAAIVELVPRRPETARPSPPPPPPDAEEEIDIDLEEPLPRGAPPVPPLLLDTPAMGSEPSPLPPTSMRAAGRTLRWASAPPPELETEPPMLTPHPPEPPPAARIEPSTINPHRTAMWVEEELDPPPPPEPPPGPRAHRPVTLPPGTLGDLIRGSAADLGGSDPFQLGPDGAHLLVRGRLQTRLSGLCWLRGELQRTPANRWPAAAEPFGEGSDRLFTLDGHGELLVAEPGLREIDLGEEPIFLLEDALFAFEEHLSYGNGHVASPVPPDIRLVQLRGRGKALLRVHGSMRSVSVGTGEPLLLPVDRLVGWTGGLTPSAVADLGTAVPGKPASGAGKIGRWLRLDGHGWALWTLPPK